jgi:hypothetical protein
MDVDPIRAQFAQQAIRDAKLQTQGALQKFEEEAIRVREGSDKFTEASRCFPAEQSRLVLRFLDT